MSISDQIAALATGHAKNRGDLEALIKSLDDKPNDSTITAQVKSLSATITAEAATLESLQVAERALMARALPAAPALIHSRPREEVKADHIFRAGVVMFDAYHTRRSFEEVLKERYPGSQLTADICTLALNRDTPDRGHDILRGQLLTRAAQDPAFTFVPGYAQELVHNTYAAFLDVLKGTSAAAKVNFRSDSFQNGAPIIVPFRNAKAPFPDNFEAAFRKEGDPIRVGRLSTGAKSIYPFSMGVIGHFSRELLRRSTPSIEAMIREAIVDDTASIMDNLIFGGGSAIPNNRPAGLTNGINAADTHAATATPTLADIDSDLNKLIKQLVAVRMMGGPQTSWVMNTANAVTLSSLTGALGQAAFPGITPQGGTLKGYPVASSSFFPLDQVLLVDGAGVFMAGGSPEFEMSTEATLHEENTAPVQIGGATTNVRSLWQTNSAALRMVEEISWDLLRAGAVQQLTGVAW